MKDLRRIDAVGNLGLVQMVLDEVELCIEHDVGVAIKEPDIRAVFPLESVEVGAHGADRIGRSRVDDRDLKGLGLTARAVHVLLLRDTPLIDVVGLLPTLRAREPPPRLPKVEPDVVLEIGAQLDHKGDDGLKLALANADDELAVDVLQAEAYVAELVWCRGW